MNLLEFSFPEWFWVAFNLLVLVVVLRKFFWKPVGKILEARQAIAVKTEEDSEAASQLRAEIERLRSEADADIEAQTTQLLTEARSRAGREYDRIVAEAEEKSARILATARDTAKLEREKMLADAKEQVTAAALAATGVLLRANMDSDRNKQLVEVFLSEGDKPA
jgi:F-type H+-transporting ATPase subunit b